MSSEKESLNFLEEIVEKDIADGKHDGRVHTRFPPEPNGYLHIGHAKAIWVNFSIAQKYGGKTNLRFDDTNPTTEETEYVNSIQKDIQWLGYQWDGEPLFTSDYFQQLYEFAVDLIKKRKAYVDDSSPEEIAALKGTPSKPGTDSPFKSRSIEENLDLFERMKAGEFEDGSKVLRANIDMASPNMLMRDPLIYRIKKETHHRTGDDWCIYPMYDFAHGQSDSIEKITHSLCSLEFMHHRPLYDWCVENLGIFPSKQTEFARMNVEYMITSKRKLLSLVNEGHVTGWDDPRMPTLSGMRNRGIPAAAIRNFCAKTGITKRENLIEISLFNSCVRDELNKIATRVMAVMKPLKVVITNYPEGQVEELPMENNREDENSGSRMLPFSREIYIEETDFMEDPPKKFFRLFPGAHSRLKGAYIIRCDEAVKDGDGNITHLNCTYFPESKSGSDNSGIKAKGVLHWVSIQHAVKAEARLYDVLFSDPSPTNHETKEYLELLNPESLIHQTIYVEPSLKEVKHGEKYQFMRTGYFTPAKESTEQHLIFNRTVTLKDGWKGKKK